MAWTQADLDTLDQALLDDTLMVQFADGRKVQKQTKADMLSLRNTIANSLASSAGPAIRATVGRVVRSCR